MTGPARNDGVLIPWLTPMRAVRGPLRDFGLPISLLIHATGVMGFIACMFIFDDVFWGGEITEGIRDTFWLEPLLIVGVFLLYLLIFEVLYLLLAWMTTCWGAGVEGYNQSLGRSLTRWYQLTPWLAIVWIGFILAVQGWESIEQWYDEHYDYARYGEYYDHNSEPMQLISRERFYLLLLMGFYGTLGVANLITLWWVLGTVMIHRNKPTWYASCRWPAVCEGCGYALAGMADDQTCPECGKAVRESTRADRGLKHESSLRLLFMGIFKPGTVGRLMVTRQPTKMPLRVLLWGLLFAVLSGPVMMIMMAIGGWLRKQMTEGYYYGMMLDDFSDILEYIVMAGLTTGIYVALVGSFLLLGAGTLVASIVRVMGKRNIMPAASSAACYSAGLLPVWVLAQGLLLVILMPLAEILDNMGRYDLVDYFPYLILGLHAGMLFYIVFHISRMTKAARFANI